MSGRLILATIMKIFIFQAASRAKPVLGLKPSQQHSKYIKQKYPILYYYMLYILFPSKFQGLYTLGQIFSSLECVGYQGTLNNIKD